MDADRGFMSIPHIITVHPINGDEAVRMQMIMFQDTDLNVFRLHKPSAHLSTEATLVYSANYTGAKVQQTKVLMRLIANYQHPPMQMMVFERCS